MHTPQSHPQRRLRNLHGAQDGVVLLITLIMLVAMTLGGIALIRSVHTTNLIAGNMAFQQSATQSGNLGAEQAISWLFANRVNAGLDQHKLGDGGSGYSATRRVPPSGTSWDVYWTNVLAPAGKVTLGTDAAGNTVEYVIDRLCNSTGTFTAAGCAISPTGNVTGGNSMGAGVQRLNFNNAVYYRIITRIQGPRSTASFVETVVAM